MQDRIERIKKLITQDKLDQAIRELQKIVGDSDIDLANELVHLQAKLNKIETDRRRDLLTWNEEERERTRMRFAILDLLSKIPVPTANNAVPSGSNSETSRLVSGSVPSVFISYSHADHAVAERVKIRLLKHGLRIRIDTDDLQPGEDITAFISRSVHDTTATICIISRTSLLSPWVALETVNTFYLQKWVLPKKFIVCFLEDNFFKPGFRLEATKEIDARIEQIDELIPSYIEEKIDTSDLNHDKSRLFDLRNNLGTILQRLKGSLCLDIREPYFERSMQRIVDFLKTNHTTLTSG